MSISKSNLNKQILSITPDTVINLFEIDFSNLQANFENLAATHEINLGAEPKYRFCPMINGTNPIVWQGKSYQPLPIQMHDFEQGADGRLPRPKLTIANPEGIFSQIVHANQDFANCQVTRKRTFARFLDKENFQNKNLNSQDKNPFGTSDSRAHFLDDIYFVNKKQSENKNAITFELVSALEIENSYVPARIMMASYCDWTYRCEIGCGYKGLPIETVEGAEIHQLITDKSQPISSISEWNPSQSYTAGEVVKIVNKGSSNPHKNAPSFFVCIKSHNDARMHHPFLNKEYWIKDECSKTVPACKKRFGSELQDVNRSANIKPPGLRFGGFPGTERYDYG